ncbi:hypothetical protein DYU05_18495 [Mucilaginibacter terrenus]|uniref:Uncharacterized protein n=1 Tax=Mucilaginibacter terrenus TaxID=2482727 RepID=A0A3E2NLF9_9SPHI|nr:hypothetical protein [Mucilaginibacter terrenus]RFZ81812.1 hypothetical protein DYU05_18495 [Mucilaginibacter terrenus]
MKNKPFVVAAMLFLTTVSFSRCDYYSNLLKVHNKSKERIAVLYSNRENPENVNNVEFYIDDYNSIPPDYTKAFDIPGKNDAWHQYIEQTPRKALFIYIFSVDKIKLYGGQVMPDIIRAHEYLAVLKYSEEDLIKNNWVVAYNGTTSQ